jgi:hypothetical protein
MSQACFARPPRSACRCRYCLPPSVIPSDWPDEEPDSCEDWQDDDRTPLECDGDALDAFLPDEQDDPLPEPGDFWDDSCDAAWD